MGPPISSPWTLNHEKTNESNNNDLDRVLKSARERPCLLFRVIDNIIVLCMNLSVVVLCLQLLSLFTCVKAGPVAINLDYLQGPSPLARNIRHLPCISRKTLQEGVCMFAIDCLKANGTHLGTCIDRFYFGSCCQIHDKTILPQIIGNSIEDNSIDSSNFVHPQTEDKIENTVHKIPEDIFSSKKTTTTEKVTTTEKLTTEKITTIKDHTDSLELETKSDDQTTLDNKINGVESKVTTAVIIETTTEGQVEKFTTKLPDLSTEVPIKLSTFQTVSSNLVTDKTEATTESSKKTTTTKSGTLKPSIITPTRKPSKPTYKPRPTPKPTNFTKPAVSSVIKPKPTIPLSVFNTTRIPYRPPPKRNTTKRPLPSPPRLNITILPVATISKPAFPKPAVSITYINTTISTTVETTSLSTTTSAPSTFSTSTTSTRETPITTIKNVETTETFIPETTFNSQKITTISSTESERATEKITTEAPKQKPGPEHAEKETLKPAGEVEVTSAVPISSSSEYPAFVTWSSSSDSTTKNPVKETTFASDENWSPITPPEGWVLISTVPQTTVPTTTTKTVPVTEAAISTLPPTIQVLTETTQHVTETTSTTQKATTGLSTEQPITTTEKPPLTTEKLTTEKTTITTEKIVLITEKPKTTTEKAASTSEKNTPTTDKNEPIIETTVSITEKTVPTTESTSLTSPTASNVSQSTAAPPMEFTVNVTLTPPSSVSTESVPSVSSDNTTAATPVTTIEPQFNMSNYKEVCGRRLWPESRIVGGNKSEFGKWPWQISLRQYRTSTFLHKCGAALLNENWAITAAHCVEHVPPSELLIRLGEHDLATEDEPYGFQERRVQLVASHPHFDPATFEYDLALIRFNQPVNFQPNIVPVCVPDTDDDFVGRTAYVTGWGRLYDEGPLPSVLQEVEVPVINNTACEGMYREAGYNEHIPNIFICAGWRIGGSDSCEGDSGGPMVIPRASDGRFVLSGIISWGIGCAEPNQPGVYTRISEFRDWINQILRF